MKNVTLRNLLGIGLEQITLATETTRCLLDGDARHIADAKVRAVSAENGKRPLGIPAVSDRIAQVVVKEYLEPELEKHFHPDSYGYRLGKSALDAVGCSTPALLEVCLGIGYRHPGVL